MSPGDRPPLNQRAVLSLGLGFIAFVLLVVEPFFSMILSLPALTIGVHSRIAIRASHGAERGFELAGIGIAMGSATLILSVVAVFIDLL